jgi:2-polyprenyl-6-methoxyphenol hydroxylase-like FAD-dependent oxidoreductase
MIRTSDPDVVVIGGGPAGATVAALVAKAGRRTLVLERDRFPRYHIGESLIPETFWVLERLGMLPKLRASRFVEKHSVRGGCQSRFTSPITSRTKARGRGR